MMKRLHFSHHLQLLSAGIILALAMISCQLTSPQKSGSDSGTSAEATQTMQSSQGSDVSDTTGVLPDPSFGLSGLQSYHIVFDQVIDGSLDGSPYLRHTHSEHSLVAQGGEDLIRQITSSAGEDYYLHAIQLGNASYTQQKADFPCQGSQVDPSQEPFTLESNLLLPLSTGELVGSETIDGIDSQHYLFDQTSLALDDPDVTASGEVWIANVGGYVVRYILAIDPPAGASGAGLEAGQTLSYELKQVNMVDPIQLPEGCSPVPVDIPVPPDASNIVLGSGYQGYSTTSEISAVIDFYNQKLPALGWQLEGNLPVSTQDLPIGMAFSLGNQRLSLSIDSSDNGSYDVTIILAEASLLSTTPAATPGPTATMEPQPTVDPANSGLPEDVPLYPGASDMQNLAPGIFMFTAGDAPEKVADFYRSELPLSGWNLDNDMTVQGQMIQSWSKDGRTLQVVATDQSGQTLVMISLG